MATQICSASSATPPPMPVMRTASPREIPASAIALIESGSVSAKIYRGNRRYLQAVSPASGHAAICSSLRCAGVWSTSVRGTTTYCENVPTGGKEVPPTIPKLQ
jgi:hypothetical protein